jgi:hypothetical protein
VDLQLDARGCVVFDGRGNKEAGEVVASFVTASHTAWAVLTGYGILVLILGVVSTGRWARATAARNGERLAAQAQESRSPDRSEQPVR